MGKFKTHVAVALTAVVLAAIGARIDSKLAAADTGPTVTIGGPVPLPVTGNVGITGTPSVNIANRPTVKLSGAADVANTAVAPLFIVNQDSPGRIGYESVVTQTVPFRGPLHIFIWIRSAGSPDCDSTLLRIHRLGPS